MRCSRIPSLVVAVMLIYGAFGLRLIGESPKPDADAPFHKELLQVAQDYKPWGRVDDEMRWSPELCRMPDPGQPKFSDSNDEDTHGKKLYSLFAKKRSDYFYLGKTKTAPVGQVIVKESWIPEVTTEVKPGRYGSEDRQKVLSGKTLLSDHFYPYTTKGDKVYKASKPNGLFIMMKLDPKTPGTDQGWVYGTVIADGKKVTAAGKVESCMKCHMNAKYDRQFWFNSQEK